MHGFHHRMCVVTLVYKVLGVCQVLRTTGDVESALGGENIFKEQPSAQASNQQIYVSCSVSFTAQELGKYNMFTIFTDER